jgi:hypothetical protein
MKVGDTRFVDVKVSRWWSCRWGEITSLNCGYQRACCSSQEKYKHGVPWWSDIDRENPDSSTRFLWQSYRSKAGGTGEGNYKFCLTKYLFLSYSKVFFNIQIFRHWADGFTSPPKESVLRIFIAIKIHSPRPGLNPRTLGPMVNTLTITPPRWLKFCEMYLTYSWNFNMNGHLPMCR